MNMAEELKNGFEGFAFLKSSYWVALFVTIQAALLIVLLKFNLQQYVLSGSASEFFYAAAPQAVILLLVSLLILKRLGVDFIRTWRDWSANYKRDIALGALYFAGCIALAYLPGLTGYLWSLQEDKSSALINNALHWGIPGFTGFLFLTCVFTPVAEELFYKRLLYAGVRQEMSALKSVILCSLLFALIHPKATVLIVFTGNLLTYYMYEKHKRLFANIVLHSLMNFFVILNKTF